MAYPTNFLTNQNEKILPMKFNTRTFNIIYCTNYNIMGFLVSTTFFHFTRAGGTELLDDAILFKIGAYMHLISILLFKYIVI